MVPLLMLTALIAACQPQLASQNSRLVSDQAAHNYYQGNFDQAIKEYEELLREGVTSSSIYYNVATVWLTKGDLGRSLMNYRYAQELAPRDTDTLAQIALVQRLSDQQHSGEKTFHHSVQAYVFTSDELKDLAFVLWSLIWVLFALRKSFCQATAPNALF